MQAFVDLQDSVAASSPIGNVNRMHFGLRTDPAIIAMLSTPIGWVRSYDSPINTELTCGSRNLG